MYFKKIMKVEPLSGISQLSGPAAIPLFILLIAISMSSSVKGPVSRYENAIFTNKAVLEPLVSPAFAIAYFDGYIFANKLIEYP